MSHSITCGWPYSSIRWLWMGVDGSKLVVDGR